ncbi:MAG: hypothetical protein GF308_07795 [Candidatus Heimdallarchaeota archaeon]|nr:hypothetical protein [Candidatus Heimdallarchaeota archaeon]
MKLIFELTTLSDFHIGSGYGKGDLDSVLLKDRFGAPVLRGSTLKGLLRQAISDLMSLDLLEDYRFCQKSNGNNDAQPYCTDKLCPTCRILGNPGVSKRWRISSANVKNKESVAQEKVTRNRVSLRTRTAEARQLFSEENCGKGAKFTFQVTTEANGKETLEEATFITAAFRMLKNFGASRRRGKGACQIHLHDLKTELDLPIQEQQTVEDYLLALFKERWLEGEELSNFSKIEDEVTPVTTSPNNFFRIVVLTEEPLLIANRQEAGYRYKSHLYIPGSTLFGALAWKAASRRDLKDEKTYEKFIKLFKRGALKVTPLYPAYFPKSQEKSESIAKTIYPTIPSPLDLLSCKLYPETEKGSHGFEHCAIKKEEPKKCEVCLSKEKKKETPLKPLNEYLVIRSLSSKNLKKAEVAIKEEMHISIDLDTGKTKPGELFSYRSIDSNQYFLGLLEVDDFQVFNEFINLENGEEGFFFNLTIGKGISRGYGKVRVWLQNVDSPADVFLGKPIQERVNVKEPITMTLLTGAILLDKWSRFQTNLDKKMLEEILGPEVEVEVFNSFVKTKNIDGFNGYLGLPKWRDVVLVSGSSIGFKVKDPSEEFLTTLQKLEEEGIGLRKAEGFGRIAFNHPIYNRNAGVKTRIRLPNSMRIPRRISQQESFDKRWEDSLSTLNQNDFSDNSWIAIARWIQENVQTAIPELINTLDELNFNEGNIKDLIKARKVSRTKELFLEKNTKGREALIVVLQKLSDILKDYENLKQPLQVKALKLLADKLADFVLSEGEQ